MSENYYGNKMDNSLEAQIGRAWQQRQDRKARIKALPPAERRKYHIEKTKDSIKGLIGFVALFAALDGVAYGAEQAFDIKPPASHEQNSPAHHNVPGNGTFQSHGRSIHISKKPHIEIGDAVAAEQVNGQFHNLDPMMDHSLDHLFRSK